MGYDYLVNLYKLKEHYEFDNLKQENIRIERVLSPNFDLVVDFVKTNFHDGWASEVKQALYKANPSCFIAIYNKKIVGFACYDATAKGYFGPIGVANNMQNKGIGRALVLTTMVNMRNDGYGYAIIGSGAGKENFYKNCVGAIRIEDDSINLYKRMV